jgi:hypothetical protein
MPKSQTERIGADTAHWMEVASDLLQADLFLMGILWAANKLNLTTSLMLICSFFLLYSSTNANGRTIALNDVWQNKENEEVVPDEGQKKIKENIGRSIKFAEYSFSLGFTFTFIGIGMTVYTIFGNIYLAIGAYLVGWLVMFSYSRRVYKKSMLKNKKNAFFVLLELISLCFIILDYLGILGLP